MAVAQDKKTSQLTAPTSIADTDVLPGYRPGTGGEPNLDIRMTVGLIRGTTPTAIAAATAFHPIHPIWLFELTCDAAGSATVTLSGVRRDDASTEVIATYNLIASQTLVDANDRTDHSSFSWTKTGTGAVTARVL